MAAPILAGGVSGVLAAVEALRAGQLVGLPTETVYGLAGDARRPDVVAAIYAAKRRPAFNPLIVHVATLDQARELAGFGPLALRLAEAFWPGPLTLVLPVNAGGPVCELARAGLDTVAVRVPQHPLARAVIATFGAPLVAPSANLSGQVSPTRAEHVAVDLADAVALVLDGGPCGQGLESTILAPTANGSLLRLRKGSLGTEALAALGMRVTDAGPGSQVIAPGMTLRHYAPRARLRLNAGSPEPGELFLGFGAWPEGARGLNLSAAGDLREAAANLFGYLRSLDGQGDAIAVASIPQVGPEASLAEAINDRLTRAAAR